MSRRAFLERVGAVGGSAAVYRSMSAMGMLAASTAKAEPFSLEHAMAPEDAFDTRRARQVRARGPKIVIVGAGIAGLCAAYELSRVGYRCLILEGRNKVGGRCETLRQGSVVDEPGHEQRCAFSEGSHLYFNSGPARIPFHHQALLNYCKSFELDLETFTNDNRAAFFYDRGKLNNAPIRGLELDTNIRGYIGELLSKAIDRGSLSRELSSDDEERLMAMLRSFGDLSRSGEFRGSGRGGYEGGFHQGKGALSPLAPRELSSLLDTDFWGSKYNFAHQTNQAPTLLQPVGGMSKIAEAFTRYVGGQILLECKVSSVFKRGDGVEVRFSRKGGRERPLQADYVILTSSAPVLMDMDVDLSANYRSALSRMSYSRAAKLAFEAPRFWEQQYGIYGGISWTSDDITQIWYPAHGYQRDTGIIGGAYIWDYGPGTSFARLSSQARIELGKEQGKRIHPEYAQMVSRGISRSWYNTDWVRGGWRQGRASPLLSEPDGRIYFAGDHVNALAGWQEGAILSAQDAASKLHARVQQTRSDF